MPPAGGSRAGPRERQVQGGDAEWHLLSEENFVAEVGVEILEMKKQNRDAEVSALNAQNRRGKAKERQELGLIDPWKSSDNGPLREVVLTADTDYFRAAADAPEDKVMITYGITEHGETVQHRLCKDKVAAFEKRGREFFEKFFPDALRHLRMKKHLIFMGFFCSAQRKLRAAAESST